MIRQFTVQTKMLFARKNVLVSKGVFAKKSDIVFESACMGWYDKEISSR